jgi:hypothetical protein
MRKPSRVVFWLVALFALLALLLLLSALVEAPAATAVADRAPSAAAVNLTALPLTTEGTAGWRGFWDALLPLLFIALAAPQLPPLFGARDRNGRVLRAGRYVRSFYPIFRQELACG